jgi:hypothetical protein
MAEREVKGVPKEASSNEASSPVVGTSEKTRSIQISL